MSDNRRNQLAAAVNRGSRVNALAATAREGDQNRIRAAGYDYLVQRGISPATASWVSGAVDWAPILGDVSGFEDAYQDFRSGDYGAAATNALASVVGTVPGVGDAAGSALGIFAGALARNADQVKLARAQDMAAQGADARAIWDETGWFQGADGQWRFEIDDSGARLTDYGRDRFIEDGAVQGVQRGIFQHPALFDAYPAVGDINTRFESHYQPGGALETLADGRQQITGTAQGSDGVAHVNVHELQHAVQNREGFAGGANLEMYQQQAEAQLARDALNWRREIAKKREVMPGADRMALEIAVINDYREMEAMDWIPSREARDLANDTPGNPDEQLEELVKFYELDKRAAPAPPMDMYRRTAGEVEARNVQTRRNMTPEQRRATPPWETEDTPRERQIVRMR